jgi:hypothetical protein
MAAIAAETFCEKVVNKIHHKYCSEFFWLYILGLINARTDVGTH